MGASKYSDRQNCGSIFLNIKTIKNKKRIFSFHCAFCSTDCDQLKKFSKHLEEKHLHHFENELENTREKINSPILLFEPEEVKIEAVSDMEPIIESDKKIVNITTCTEADVEAMETEESQNKLSNIEVHNIGNVKTELDENDPEQTECCEVRDCERETNIINDVTERIQINLCDREMNDTGNIKKEYEDSDHEEIENCDVRNCAQTANAIKETTKQSDETYPFIQPDFSSDEDSNDLSDVDFDDANDINTTLNTNVSKSLSSSTSQSSSSNLEMSSSHNKEKSSLTLDKKSEKDKSSDNSFTYTLRSRKLLNSDVTNVAENSDKAPQKNKSNENTLARKNIYKRNRSRSKEFDSNRIEVAENEGASRDSLNSNSNTCLQDNENSEEETISALNITKVKVPYSTKSKKHFCIFCKTLQTKLARHLLLKHKSEKEIKSISKLPKKHKDRVNTLNQLRKNGDFLHNTTKSLNTGVLIVSRQQHAKAKNEADDYVCCRNCKGFFSKKTLRIHLRSCGEAKKNDRTNLIISRKLTQYIHEDANQILRTEIFPILRTDEITNVIRYDDLIIKYGNKMSEKYTLSHQHDMIRSHLRLLGRFKIAVTELCSDVKYLKEIFKPQMYDICVKALRKVANWDDTLMCFKTPAVAQSLTLLVKNCGYQQRTENVDKFLLLWEKVMTTVVNKNAYEDRNSKIMLPSKESIKKLYILLKTKIIKYIKVLEDKFCLQSWIELIKLSLIFILILNRRKSEEIEKLTISNYENKEVITDNMEKDMLKNISKESLEFAKQFMRITIKGKLGRTFSVLLNPLSIIALDIIIKYRETAGIPTTNDYIFCKTDYSNLSPQYLQASPLLRKYSAECGVVLPESLEGTTLQEHIATYTTLLNIDEANVDNKNANRISIPVAEIKCVSKLLMNAIADKNEEEDDEMSSSCMVEDAENSSNIPVSVAADCSECENSLISEELPKRNSLSPYIKTKRCRWSPDERRTITSHFGCLKELEKLPSLVECLEVIKRFPVLENRTPQQIKSWIDNQRRYK